ncbi:hypothetical protein GCM10009801_21370 [Streptomyces albiaxialis]|uniref:Uncharacterized protein n=1 Tax=Streptomyces albiaxialis TaxID=329523 RepID=A0ABN2VRW8_9ACTN
MNERGGQAADKEPGTGRTEPMADGGRVVAATEAFVTHRAPLFTVAHEMLGSSADAEGVLQETWLPGPLLTAPDVAENVELADSYEKSLRPRAFAGQRRFCGVPPTGPRPFRGVA